MLLMWGSAHRWSALYGQTVVRPFRTAILVGVLVSLGPAAGQSQPPVRSKTPILPVKRTIGSVTVLEHGAAAFDRAARLGLELAPIASAGGAEAGDTFDLTRAHSVVLLSDGRIAAFSTLESRLLVFGRDGRGRYTFGRKGQGPGEFVAAMSMLRLIRDTLLIPDQGTGRRNWVLPRSDTAWNATAFRADGALLGRLHSSSGGTPAAFGDDRVVVRSVDRDGVVSLRVYRIRANGATTGG
jgi:hypothetical protein